MNDFNLDDYKVTALGGIDSLGYTGLELLKEYDKLYVNTKHRRECDGRTVWFR